MNSASSRDSNVPEDVEASDGQGTVDIAHEMYVPAHPLVRDRQVVVGYETRELEPGRPVLPVFTTEAKLVAQLGTVQPWVTIKLDSLIELMGAGFLAMDPIVDPDAERWSAREVAEHEALIRRELGRSS
jgi:hypothetical protein